METIEDHNQDRKNGRQIDSKAGGVQNKHETSRGLPKSPRPAERVTALRGQAIAPPRLTPAVRRKIAERELLNDSDIPYEEFEKALRGIICSFIERQDRAGEALLLHLNDLQYRMDDLEDDVRELNGQEGSDG